MYSSAQVASKSSKYPNFSKALGSCLFAKSNQKAKRMYPGDLSRSSNVLPNPNFNNQISSRRKPNLLPPQPIPLSLFRIIIIISGGSGRRMKPPACVTKPLHESAPPLGMLHKYHRPECPRSEIWWLVVERWASACPCASQPSSPPRKPLPTLLFLIRAERRMMTTAN